MKNIQSYSAHRVELLSSDARALFDYECTGAAEDPEHIQELRGEPFADPFKIEALKCLYQKIIDVQREPTSSIRARAKRTEKLREIGRRVLDGDISAIFD